MDKHIETIIRKATKATHVLELGLLQTLWSGYGRIVRYSLEGSSYRSVVVKHVQLPSKKNHPRNWNTDLSHKRKLKSYRVETAWYDTWSKHCTDACRVPKCLGLESQGDEILMVLEDLDDAGFPTRRKSVSWAEFKACLSWLAHFHAIFMHEIPDKLWKNGTYWHLDTRPDELLVLDDLPLKKAAGLIDLQLKKSPFLTFVHGDAKLANFCFSPDGKNISAVDFQYVGGGCGMKDVAYFVGSCFGEDDCEQLEPDILDYYFSVLKEALQVYAKPIAADALELNWRELYPVAWTDFHRFIKGWSPDHWKINTYSERVARQVIQQLQTTQQELR
jgi:Ecdysteroid kinase-like family